MFTKIIVFIVLFGAGVLILRYTEPIVHTVGKSGWAEQHLGAGGTYNMWKIIAIIAMLIGFLYLLGVIDLFGFNNVQIPGSSPTPLP
jgi:hypothetical protein